MIACVRIPYFGVGIEALGNPRFSTLPIIVVRYTPTGRGKVIGYSAQAESLGVEAGMLSVRAAALCPEAILTAFAPNRYRRALLGVMTCLTAYSQWIEADRNYAQTAYLYLDLGKLRPSDGRQLAAQMITRLASDEHLSSAVGLAADKFTAYAAACTAGQRQTQLIARGDEAAFLAPLPLSLLSPDRETARRFSLLGLQTLGQLAAIPRGAMLAQFGDDGRRFHRWSSGEDERRVAKFVEPLTERTTHTFDNPIDDRLIIQNVLCGAALELAERLKRLNVTSRSVTVTGYLERGAQLEDHRHLRKPISTFAAIYRALQTALGRMSFHDRLERIDVELSKLESVAPQQLSLFDTEPKIRIRDVVVEVASKYGDERIYTAALDLRRSHIPELAFYLQELEPA
jgi:nucleotidyltransferase/DNA polymerase involved in DNA repair